LQRGRPKLRWQDGVKEDARKLEERNWRNAARNRDSWQKLQKKALWLRMGCCANDDDDDDDVLLLIKTDDDDEMQKTQQISNFFSLTFFQTAGY
jgi:hypothetical protein